MTTRIKDKHAAKQATRIAQIAALALAVGGAIAVAKLPGLEVKDIELAPAGPVSAGIVPEQPKGDTTPPPDRLVTADNFSYIANVPEAVAVVEEPRDEPPVETGGRLSDFDVRFVGSITSGGRAAAFVNIAGVTKVLRPGDTYEGVRLVEVVGNEIAVSIDGGEEEMIRKSERKGSAVSVAIGGAPAAPVNTPNTAVAGDEPNQLSPDMSREERRAALLERARSDRGRWQRDRGQNGGPPN
ncbi:MAG: hypothetical protein ACF8R9_04705 [Phycisphaerales bacterium JB054]